MAAMRGVKLVSAGVAMSLAASALYVYHGQYRIAAAQAGEIRHDAERRNVYFHRELREAEQAMGRPATSGGRR